MPFSLMLGLIEPMPSSQQESMLSDACPTESGMSIGVWQNPHAKIPLTDVSTGRSAGRGMATNLSPSMRTPRIEQRLSDPAVGTSAGHNTTMSYLLTIDSPVLLFS